MFIDLLLYFITFVLLTLSFIKDPAKTTQALMKAWKSFENILPQLLSIVIMVGIMLSFFDAETISSLIGDGSGIKGILLSLFVGSITLIPGFIAFPTAAMLLANGAGYMQVAAFVSSLMMVGIITLPVEIRYFGFRLSLARNSLSLLFCFFVAWIVGKVVGAI